MNKKMHGFEIDLEKELEWEKYVKEYNGLSYVCDSKDAAPLKIGSRVRKISGKRNDDDITPDGVCGKIIGSISTMLKIFPDLPPQCSYTVVWDDKPDIPISMMSYKLEPIENDKTKTKT